MCSFPSVLLDSPGPALLDAAMLYAASAVDWSREYSYWANKARRSTGRKRCVCAAYAGDAKRRALRYAGWHGCDICNAPADRRPIDSPDAYDSVARAALAFASADGADVDGAWHDGVGYVVARCQ